jgi:hypothetical protein
MIRVIRPAMTDFLYDRKIQSAHNKQGGARLVQISFHAVLPHRGHHHLLIMVDSSSEPGGSQPFPTNQLTGASLSGFRAIFMRPSLDQK